ncbi:MAG: sulfite exporter TauE/SafE family protein [Actinobacteria bacterium]|nr:sulfite exporter TauE/SafE family protein [Actinomycetota bacterium]
MFIEYLKFFGIGLLTSSIVTLLGIGGGLIILPILIYFTDIGLKAATAISAVQVFFASSFGTFFNRLQKTINYRYAIIFGISSGTTYFLGSYFTGLIPENTIKMIYLCSVILALILFFMKRNNNNENDLELAAQRIPGKADYFKIIPISLISGFFFGVLGVGGGFLYVPLLILLFKLPLKVAIGTSLMIVLFNAIPGIVGKLLSIRFDIFLGLAVAVGAIIGSRIGTYLNKKISEKIIKIIFTLLLVLIIARVAWDLYASFNGGGPLPFNSAYF